MAIATKVEKIKWPEVPADPMAAINEKAGKLEVLITAEAGQGRFSSRPFETVQDKIAFGKAITACLEKGALASVLPKPELDILRLTKGGELVYVEGLIGKIAEDNALKRDKVEAAIARLREVGVIDVDATETVVGRTACVTFEGLAADIREFFNQAGHREDVLRLLQKEGFAFGHAEPDDEYKRGLYGFEMKAIKILIENWLIRPVKETDTATEFGLTNLGEYFMRNFWECRLPQTLMPLKEAANRPRDFAPSDVDFLRSIWDLKGVYAVMTHGVFPKARKKAYEVLSAISIGDVKKLEQETEEAVIKLEEARFSEDDAGRGVCLRKLEMKFATFMEVLNDVSKFAMKKEVREYAQQRLGANMTCHKFVAQAIEKLRPDIAEAKKEARRANARVGATGRMRSEYEKRYSGFGISDIQRLEKEAEEAVIKEGMDEATIEWAAKLYGTSSSEYELAKQIYGESQKLRKSRFNEFKDALRLISRFGPPEVRKYALQRRKEISHSYSYKSFKAAVLQRQRETRAPA